MLGFVLRRFVGASRQRLSRAGRCSVESLENRVLLTSVVVNGADSQAAVSNYKASATTHPVALAATAAPAAPMITTEPANVTAGAGESVSFTAAASGSPAPTVQWQLSSNGTMYFDIPDATSTTFTVTTAAGDNGILLRAVFTNSQGSATTTPATLTISTTAAAAPIVTAQPASQNVTAGAAATFAASASGDPTPTVQWQISSDGNTFNDIPGATSATYTFTTTADQNGNQFRAVFSNSQGSVATNPAVLTFARPPSPVVPSLGNIVFPAVAVVGVPFNGRVPVVITNSGATTLTGAFILNLYANPNSVLDGNQTLITSLKSHLTLKPGKSRRLIIKVRSLPAGLVAGAYYAVTQVVDPKGATNAVSTMQPFQLAAAKITVNIDLGNVLPATISSGQSGSVNVTVANTGNVTATGPLVVTLSPSSDGISPVAGPVLAQLNAKRVRIPPGKSVKLKLRFKITAAATMGTYFPSLSVSLAGVSQTAVGSTQFTIG